MRSLQPIRSVVHLQALNRQKGRQPGSYFSRWQCACSGESAHFQPRLSESRKSSWLERRDMHFRNANFAHSERWIQVKPLLKSSAQAYKVHEKYWCLKKKTLCVNTQFTLSETLCVNTQFTLSAMANLACSRRNWPWAYKNWGYSTWGQIEGGHLVDS
jgi:hypothetical protein